MLVSLRGGLSGLSGFEKVVNATRGGLLDDLRGAPAIPGSVLGKVTYLGVERAGGAQQRVRRILADSYRRLRGRTTY